MNKPFKNELVALSLMLTTLIPGVASAENNPSYTSTNQQQVEGYSQAQLAQILAPIALYPDTLLTQILMAATYPLEIVEAQRWLEKNTKPSSTQINRRIENKDWDESVKALIAFPNILASLNDDLTWLQDLGNAFLYDDVAVLDSIQLLRQQADNAGNLSQMDNVTIVKEQKVIIIESAFPEVVYVPYYDTRAVYGDWRWRHHPPIYWHRPVDYTYSYGHFYWNRGVHVSMNLFFGAFHWHKKQIVVHHKPVKYRSAKHIYSHKQSKRWLHNNHHRRGVKYRSHNVKERYTSPKAKHRVVKNIKVNSKKREVIHHKTFKPNKQFKYVNKKQVKIEKKHRNKVHEKTRVNKVEQRRSHNKTSHARQEKKYVNKTNNRNEYKQRSSNKVAQVKHKNRSHSGHQTRQHKSHREKQH